MVKEIEEFEDLQALRLEGNTVGVEAAKAIAKALETKSMFKVHSVFLRNVLSYLINISWSMEYQQMVNNPHP